MKFVLHRDRLRWRPDMPAVPELAAWLAGERDGAVLVKASGKRSVYALRPAPTAPPAFFLKHEHPREWRDVLKSAWLPRVLREYEAGRALAVRGVPVAEHVACGWHWGQGLLLTRAIAGARHPRAVWAEAGDDPQARQGFLRGLSRFLGRLVECGLAHPDLHLGNLLAVTGADGLSFFLADVDRCRLRERLSERERLALLGVLNGFRNDLSSEEMALVLGPLTAPGETAVGLWRELERHWMWDLRHRWRGRRRRLIRGRGGWADVRRDGTGVWRWREGFALEVAAQAVAHHRLLVASAPEKLLKNDRKRRLSATTIGGQRLVVKEFTQPGPWGPFSPDWRSWLANWHLEMAGMPVPKYLAWRRDRWGGGYLVMEHVDGPTLDLALAGASPERLGSLLLATRGLLERLYRCGIVHGDLKTQNLIVAGWRGDEPRLVLVDNDDVAFDRHPSTADRERNLAQLRETLPEVAAVKAAFEEAMAGMTDGRMAS